MRIEYLPGTIWDPAQEHIARKIRSEARLQAEGVPFITHLPGIDTEAEAKIREVEEVARRAMALLVVAIKGVSGNQELVDRVVEMYDLRDDFTPHERAFLWGEGEGRLDSVKASWRFEAAWALLWALGYVDELGRPEREADPDTAVDFLRKRGAERFVAEAKLRSTAEILDEADLIYRYDWATTDARIKGDDPPAGLHPGVVYERHYALNWLMCYFDQEWDDVSTDT
ncbi:MAG TPA: DUF4272 domain-containing protein [Longimicrobiaceae bacterium]